MKPRFAASWHTLQAAVSLSKAAANFPLSRALMAPSISPIGGMVVDFDHFPDGSPLIFGNALGDIFKQFL